MASLQQAELQAFKKAMEPLVDCKRAKSAHRAFLHEHWGIGLQEFCGRSCCPRFRTEWRDAVAKRLREKVAAREAGCATATGVDMFVRQAALQFEIFTDREAPIEMMRSQFKQTIGAARQ